MQFLLKWDINAELGGDKAPISCDVRLGVAFDDQPTANLLGQSDPRYYLEEERSGVKRALLPRMKNLQLF